MRKHLFLIGLPGCGKSTVGKLAAQELGLFFSDTDAVVEEQTGQTIPWLFEHCGERAFREKEALALQTLCTRTERVIATGGGTVLREENRRLMQRCGRVIYLETSPEVIAGRIAPQGRPLLAQHSVSELLRQRECYYLECADVVIQTQGVNETVQRIVDYWRGRVT